MNHGKKVCFIVFGLLMLIMAGCSPSTAALERSLAETISDRQIQPLDFGPPPDPALVTLGQALYFDKVLSGNRDISCATCHHPVENSADGLPLSIGTGGSGLGPERTIGYERSLIPRNAPDVFNRGAPMWRTMFWDSRVDLGPDGSIRTPAGADLPEGLANVLAAQAMFPVTSRDEMRGALHDTDVNGQLNELAAIDDDDLTAVWQGLMDRILATPEYVALFQAAYPDLSISEFGFQHAANAIAAFEIATYTLNNSPWDRYLAGDKEALSDDAKQGALIFFGKGQCSACHAPPLFTDQLPHVLAIPQLGPGKQEDGLDYCRFAETGVDQHKYAFRTPPLRNVTFTGPWSHNGAFSSLEAMIGHHLNPEESLRNYDPTQHLPAALQSPYSADETVIADMLSHLDPRLAQIEPLSDDEINYLLAFLGALGDPTVEELDHYVPDRVPSGLPVND